MPDSPKRRLLREALARPSKPDPTTPPDDREAAEEILGGQEIVFEGAPCLAVEPEAVDRIAAALSALRERAEALEARSAERSNEAQGLLMKAIDNWKARAEAAERESREWQSAALAAADRAEAAERERDKWKDSQRITGEHAAEILNELGEAAEQRDAAEARLARLEGAARMVTGTAIPGHLLGVMIGTVPVSLGNFRDLQDAVEALTTKDKPDAN